MIHFKRILIKLESSAASCHCTAMEISAGETGYVVGNIKNKGKERQEALEQHLGCFQVVYCYGLISLRLPNNTTAVSRIIDTV